MSRQKRPQYTAVRGKGPQDMEGGEEAGVRTHRCENDHDLHPCAQPGRERSPESGGCADTGAQPLAAIMELCRSAYHANSA